MHRLISLPKHWNRKLQIVLDIKRHIDSFWPKGESKSKGKEQEVESLLEIDPRVWLVTLLAPQFHSKARRPHLTHTCSTTHVNTAAHVEALEFLLVRDLLGLSQVLPSLLQGSFLFAPLLFSRFFDDHPASAYMLRGRFCPSAAQVWPLCSLTALKVHPASLSGQRLSNSTGRPI